MLRFWHPDYQKSNHKTFQMRRLTALADASLDRAIVDGGVKGSRGTQDGADTNPRDGASTFRIRYETWFRVQFLKSEIGRFKM